MAQRTLYLSTTRSELRPDEEHCHEEQPVLCAPECLVQPRFFCGQLLTDQDLNALLQWSRSKFRLDRYKLGWGVVCGLDLRCHPEVASAVELGPGYAVDSCGNDIVVCEPATFELADACRLPDSPCEDIAGALDLPPIDWLGLQLPPGELVALDLYIHYAEEESQPLPALGRGACTERDACEFSRTRETYTLEWRHAGADQEPGNGSLRAWEAGYFSQSRRVVDAYVARFGVELPPNMEEVKCWLLDWIAREGLHHFCSLRAAVDGLDATAEAVGTANTRVTDRSAKGTLGAALTRILTFLVMDARLAYLALGCTCGDPGQGVPLGRVWLRRRGGATRACQVLHVDGAVPYRRLLSQDRWPAPFNHLNLGQFVLQPVDWVCALLRDLGVPWEQEPLNLPLQVAELRQGLDEEQQDPDAGLFLDLGGQTGVASALRLTVYTQAPLGARVIAFRHRTGGDYGAGRRPGEVPARPEAAPPAETPVTEARPPAAAEPDPLTAINGVGQEREFKLRQLNIKTYQQLADADSAALKKAFPRVSVETIEGWKMQAKRLQRK